MPQWFTVVFTTTSEAKVDLFDEKIDAHPCYRAATNCPYRGKGWRSRLPNVPARSR
jgi:hypothetical protein